MSGKKLLRCRLGWHSWYRDCALIRSVQRCNDCSAVDDRKAAEALAAERARLDAAPAGASLGELYAAALDYR